VQADPVELRMGEVLGTAVLWQENNIPLLFTKVP
jgi:hypothetical protein